MTWQYLPRLSCHHIFFVGRTILSKHDVTISTTWNYSTQYVYFPQKIPRRSRNTVPRNSTISQRTRKVTYNRRSRSKRVPRLAYISTYIHLKTNYDKARVHDTQRKERNRQARMQKKQRRRNRQRRRKIKEEGETKKRKRVQRGNKRMMNLLPVCLPAARTTAWNSGSSCGCWACRGRRAEEAPVCSPPWRWPTPGATLGSARHPPTRATASTCECPRNFPFFRHFDSACAIRLVIHLTTSLDRSTLDWGLSTSVRGGLETRAIERFSDV